MQVFGCVCACVSACIYQKALRVLMGGKKQGGTDIGGENHIFGDLSQTNE